MSAINNVGSFTGIFDNVHVNGYKYNLWKSTFSEGVLLYAPFKTPMPKLTDGSRVTLFGTGFIKQRMGAFQVSGSCFIYCSSLIEFLFGKFKPANCVRDLYLNHNHSVAQQTHDVVSTL